MNTVRIPEILLPGKDTDMKKWAVNACDQFTSDEDYWKKTKECASGGPSAFNLILPEIYLPEAEQRIEKIHSTMREYLSNGVFRAVKGFVLVERITQSGTRRGIVLSIDLEDYSYEKGAKVPVRSTEATILERIPPRVEIRRGAPLELPHAMLLYDDNEESVLNCVKRGEVLYDFPLMCDGGRVKGTLIENSDEVVSSLYALTAKENFSEDKFLFAVGDGNHSLAAAKACWEEIKSTVGEKERETHPARFALCEAVNIYSPALKFEAIHRYVKTDDAAAFAEGLKTSGGQSAYIVVDGTEKKIPFDDNVPKGIEALDCYISEFLKEHGGEADYIHGGMDEMKSLTSRGGAGIILPAIKKDDFFRLIATGGNLPRKTFSMGDGNEKRYYIEAKRIK